MPKNKTNNDPSEANQDDISSPGGNSAKKYLTWIIPAALALLIIAAGLVWFLVFRDTSPDKVAQPKTEPITLTYEEREQQELERAKQKVSRDEANNESSSQKAKDYYDLGVAYDNTNRPKKAIELYNKVAKLDPSYERKVLSALMYSYVDDGQPDKALETGEKLMKLIKSEHTNDPSIDALQNDLDRLRAGKRL